MGTALKEFEEDLNEESGCWLKHNEFRVKYGMNRSSFWKIHDMIKGHSVFSKKDSRGRKQIDSKYQLMMLLAFLRTEGDGMSRQKGRSCFYVSYGSVGNYRDRVVKAIMDVLFEKHVSWPSPEERKQIAARWYKQYGIPNLVAVADGTLFPLAFKPQRIDYPDFHGRKHLYSLSTLIVNDDRRKVRYFLAGWAGSAHDERIFSNSRLATNHEMFFAPHEFLIGDSAYSPRNYVIPAFKKCGGNISVENEIFNTHISKPRVSSEHTIGMHGFRF